MYPEWRQAAGETSVWQPVIDVTARGEAVGLKKYIEAQRHNAIVSQRLPEFRDLMPLIDQVYARAVRLVQSAGAAAVIQGPMPDVVARALVLCQRTFSPRRA
jgi:hypothetical protein